MGGGSTTSRAVVHAGLAYQLNSAMLKQELIANMLGVRREGVTVAAGKLRKPGLIYYKRGHIEAIDRAGIEAMSCGCYIVVKK